MANNKMNFKIVFIGTPEFGAIILEKLIQSNYLPAFIVTTSDKPVGRRKILTPSPVKLLAKKHNIKIIQLAEIKKLKLDLGIVAAFGQKIPKQILDVPKYGFINVHPSLLPRYRGPSPIQTAILNKDRETGVTIIKMTEEIDAGPIVSNIKYSISNNKITYQELHDILAKIGADLLIKTIPLLIKGEIKIKKQDELKVSYSKILKKEDGKIDWRKPAEVLERQIRAFYLWPGSYTIWQNRNKLIKIKILKARVFKSLDKKKYPIGKVVVPKNEIHIQLQCKKDFLVIEKLKPEGKKEMLAEDFLRGHLDFIGTILF